MHFSAGTISSLGLASLLVHLSAAAPGVASSAVETLEFTKRATPPPNGPSNPITVEVNPSNWQETAEYDCYIMLCKYHGRTIWQKASTAQKDENRKKSGVDKQPFADPDKFGVKRITVNTKSAEESIFASIDNSDQTILFPTTLAQQRAQGGQLSKIGKLSDGEFFKLHFNPPNTGVYCKALYKSATPDQSVCGKANPQTMFGVKNVDLRKFGFVLQSGDHFVAAPEF